MKKKRKKQSLQAKYPPSEPCECSICKAYCRRPGWWTVEEAKQAINAGYWKRMMLELSPDFSFGVLSPAFKGCEMNFAYQEYARFGCNFFVDGLCELHGTGCEPMECRYCHHAREGSGAKCHRELEKDWNTAAGRQLVTRWLGLTGLGERPDVIYISKT